MCEDKDSQNPLIPAPSEDPANLPPLPPENPETALTTPPAVPPEPPKRVFSGRGVHFHISFWPMLILMLCVMFPLVGAISGGPSSLFTTIFPPILLCVSILLRVCLEKRNHYLAKGFLWGGLVGFLLPFLLLLLLYGSCLLLVGLG